MTTKHKKHGKKYFALHGHFYQPPRENPWSGEIDEQPSAQPYHDWNSRIARECYIPNSTARIYSEGKIKAIASNYDYLNFNYGPTLLNWFAKSEPHYFEKVVDAARQSKERTGHSNAIAQGYNHIILPLANDRDRLTQLRWGLADYKHHFGFAAEALWLPETACSNEILSLLAGEGLRYVILAPSQADKVLKYGETKWQNVADGSIDTRRPYLWEDGKGAELAVFFYDGNLSHDLAFDGLLKDSELFAKRISACYSDTEEDQLVFTATDGETFGHHKKFADLTIVHLFTDRLEKHNIESINLGRYLALHPPLWQVRIKSGEDGEGTAWSCAHGLRRWRADCGCGAEEGQNQKWRAPLRDALNWLSGELAKLFESEGGKLFTDPWLARDQYINVMLGDEKFPDFLARTAPNIKGGQAAAKAAKLLEMQKYAMFMFTSCGWFFSDVSRIETRQNLFYACRAMEAAAYFGHNFEDELITRLKKAPSNIAEIGTAGDMYEKDIKRRLPPAEAALAELAIKNAIDERTCQTDKPVYSAKIQPLGRRAIGGFRIVYGKGVFTDRAFMETCERAFISVIPPASEAVCFIGQCGEQKMRAITQLVENMPPEAAWQHLSADAEQTVGREVKLRELGRQARLEILILLQTGKMGSCHLMQRNLFSEYLPLIEQWHELEMDVPETIAAEMTVGARQYVLGMLEQYRAEPNDSLIADMEQLVTKLQSWKMSVNCAEIRTLSADIIRAEFAGLRKKLSAEALTRVRRIIRIANKAGITHWFFETQNIIIETAAAAKGSIPEPDAAKELNALLAEMGIAIPEIMPVK